MHELTGGTVSSSRQGDKLGDKPDNQRGLKGKSPRHYTPILPIQPSPYFRWPPEASAIARWMFDSWFSLSERLLLLLLAIVSSVFFILPWKVALDFQLIGLRRSIFVILY